MSVSRPKLKSGPNSLKRDCNAMTRLVNEARARPYRGVMSWQKVFEMLEDENYCGCVSIELEDFRFNGRQETERVGIAASFLFFTDLLRIALDALDGLE